MRGATGFLLASALWTAALLFAGLGRAGAPPDPGGGLDDAVPELPTVHDEALADARRTAPLAAEDGDPPDDEDDGWPELHLLDEALDGGWEHDEDPGPEEDPGWWSTDEVHLIDDLDDWLGGGTRGEPYGFPTNEPIDPGVAPR